MLFFFYTPDLVNNVDRFVKAAGVRDLADRLGARLVVRAPRRRWYLGGVRNWTRHDLMPELVEVTRQVHQVGRMPIVTGGYSDGGTMAWEVAVLVSQAVVSCNFGGRLFYTPKGRRSFHAMHVWNSGDKRKDSNQAKQAEQKMRDCAGSFESITLENGYTHWDGWDPLINHAIAKRVDLMLTE